MYFKYEENLIPQSTFYFYGLAQRLISHMVCVVDTHTVPVHNICFT